MTPVESKCTVCGGTRLEEGQLSIKARRFYPSRVGTFFGYLVNGYVCMDCGFLGHYLNASDLAKLRRKLQ